jgi:GTP pyrophosphokinase
VPYRIQGRPKSIFSIWNKIKTKKVSFEEIYDLFAIRIICDVPLEREKQVCWQIYSIVTDVYNPIPERLKDWITTPKSNGYESLHTSVIGPKGRFVEVQIRTERMDEIAERGFAAHWKYKGVNQSQDVYDNWLNNVRDILDNNQQTDAIEFLSDFKTNLFHEEVYVYTPAGDMKILPKGATALDFAFSIHSDVGYHCTSIKVNNKLVPMGYKLENGDQLKVITSKNQRPTDDWLKMVVTGKARSKIRSALKEERRKQGIFGQEALERKMKNMKVDFEQNVDKIVRHYGLKHRPDLYYAIATEEIQVGEIFKEFEVEDHDLVLSRDVEQRKEAEKAPPEKKKDKRRPKKGFKPKLLINGEPGEQYNYSFANCCNPLPGDDIFAYLTAGSGIKIHRNNCPNATHLMAHYGYRIMRADWVHAGNEPYVVDLSIAGVDDGPGVIERLTSSISTELGINIRSFQIEGNGGYFEGKMSLQVMNKDQMNRAIRVLKNLKGISNVSRVNE